MKYIKTIKSVMHRRYKNRLNTLSDVILILIVAGGFLFRLKGIQDNHSFWADEADIASVSKALVQHNMSLSQALAAPGPSYQPLLMILGTLSFILFGISEQSARIVPVLFSTLGIILAFFLGSKLSNKNGGLLAAFMYAFFQMNLSIATQFKPYAAIQTCFLAIFYIVVLLREDKNKRLLTHIIAVSIGCVSTLLHPLGALVWMPYVAYLLVWREKYFKNNILFFIGILFLASLMLLSQIRNIFIDLSYLIPHVLLKTNNMTYLRELLWRNYNFIFLPALFGIMTSFSKNKFLAIIGLSLTLPLLFLWTFMSPTHNLRYIVPFFAVLLVYFAVFWAEVGEKVFQKKSAWVCLVIALVLFIGGYKFVRKPEIYYNPNADFYGDVQIADYKTAFSMIKAKYPDSAQMAIFNDIPAPQKWYLNRPATAYFLKGISKSDQIAFDDIKVYGTLDDFLNLKSKHLKGILIVEDWESLLPEEIKQYAKKNMKREIRVEGLPQAAGDNWPIEVYSWGMNQ